MVRVPLDLYFDGTWACTALSALVDPVPDDCVPEPPEPDELLLLEEPQPAKASAATVMATSGAAASRDVLIIVGNPLRTTELCGASICRRTKAVVQKRCGTSVRGFAPRRAND